MRRLIPSLVIVVGLAACSTDDPASSTASAPTPIPNATYRGEITPAPGVTGRVKFEISADGDLVDPYVMLELKGFSCNDGTAITDSTQLMTPIGVSIPISDGQILYESSASTWRGSFTSESTATGTVEGDFIQPRCAFGPYEWTAEYSGPAESASTETTTTVAATTTSPPASTSTTGTPAQEYEAMCAVNDAIVERAARITPGTEDQEFWEAQRDDKRTLVDLVPADLRADADVAADAWRDLVMRLSQYAYDFQAMIDAAGVESYTSIFTPEVVASEQRVADFAAAQCAG